MKQLLVAVILLAAVFTLVSPKEDIVSHNPQELLSRSEISDHYASETQALVEYNKAVRARLDWLLAETDRLLAQCQSEYEGTDIVCYYSFDSYGVFVAQTDRWWELSGEEQHVTFMEEYKYLYY